MNANVVQDRLQVDRARSMTPGRWYTAIKRLIDVVGSGVGLIVLSPFLAAIALTIRLDSPGPVIFRQERLGRYGVPFVMYKFRSMRTVGGSSRQGPLVTARGDQRVTQVGRFLRRHKLDELPQLANVLRGQMSLVGPRPEVDRYARAYPTEYGRILSVPPGITDFATLEFHREEDILAHAIDTEKAYVEQVLPAKIRLYLRYIEERSVRTDLLLIGRTLGRIAR
ncbi:MAG: sugar transferase [Chloroflexota bacterium]